LTGYGATASLVQHFQRCSLVANGIAALELDSLVVNSRSRLLNPGEGLQLEVGLGTFQSDQRKLFGMALLLKKKL